MRAVQTLPVGELIAIDVVERTRVGKTDDLMLVEKPDRVCISTGYMREPIAKGAKNLRQLLDDARFIHSVRVDSATDESFDGG